MAVLENQFKKTMGDSEKIAIAIEKLPVEYQPVLTAEMRKEGSLLTAQHMANAAFQHWQSVDGSYANNTVIDGSNKEEKDKEKNFQCSVEPATGVADEVTKKLNVMQRNTSMVEH